MTMGNPDIIISANCIVNDAALNRRGNETLISLARYAIAAHEVLVRDRQAAKWNFSDSDHLKRLRADLAKLAEAEKQT